MTLYVFAYTEENQLFMMDELHGTLLEAAQL